MSVKVTLTILEANALWSAASTVADDLDPSTMTYGFDGRSVAAYERAMKKLSRALVAEERKA